MKRKLLQGAELEARAKELGVYSYTGLLRQEELQRQVMDAERSIREHRLWWVALFSAVASAFSAAAAWWAVVKCK
jgi:hypothetical protein